MPSLFRSSQVKRFCSGCGGGGDWGLRVRAERDPAAPRAQPDGDVGDGADPPPDRISLLFYLADEEVNLSKGCFGGETVIDAAGKQVWQEALRCLSKKRREHTCCLLLMRNEDAFGRISRE